MALVDQWIWGLLHPMLPDELRLVCMEVKAYPNLLHVYERYGIVEIKWCFYAYFNTELKWCDSYIASWSLEDDSLVYIRDHHARDTLRKDADTFVEDLSEALEYRYYVENKHIDACLEGLDDLHTCLA